MEGGVGKHLTPVQHQPKRPGANRVKIDYGNFNLDLSRKFFDLQAVLSVTECIGCIVFKWVENTNSNGP